jgi:phosphoribosylanthranilate isomerase
MQRVHVKICGLTDVDDARACVEAGASSIGLNFVPSSPRRIDAATARAIVESIEAIPGVGPRVVTVAVVADMPTDELRALLSATGIRCMQLHGDEPPEQVAAFLPHAYKALRVATAADVARADAFPGEHILVDARVDGALGGTGVQVDPALVVALARRRKLTLAGGLRPENVAAAIAAVRPFAVDVASGVERPGAPRRKDRDAVRAFLAEVRRAESALADEGQGES